jgi:glucosamine-6-phosphate deaminase
MNNELFNHINIDPKNTAVPDGTAEDPEESCRAYEAHIDELGGIDIQVLGIGRNGHIGFNEPADELHANTHLTALTEDTIDANSRFFENEADVPRHAMTMGIGSIFKAKKVIILANGEGKAEAIRGMICGGINPHLPASLLQLHPDVTVICDTKAYALVK